MDFNAPTENYYWKIGIWGCYNCIVMLIHRFYECADYPLNLVYVVLQDSAMWTEFCHMIRESDLSEVKWYEFLDVVTRINWSFQLYLFTVIGIHVALFRDLVYAKPEYCKELNERLGLS